MLEQQNKSNISAAMFDGFLGWTGLLQVYGNHAINEMGVELSAVAVRCILAHITRGMIRMERIENGGRCSCLLKI